MKPIIIYNDKFLNAISWFMVVGGISLFPFIILREKHNSTIYRRKKAKRIINHESIHFHQTLECGIFLFYIIYLIEWVIKSIMYMDTYKGYKNISFEREAYQNDENLTYLKNRKLYSWINYIR